MDASLIDTARQWPENLGSGKPYPENADEHLEDWLTQDPENETAQWALAVFAGRTAPPPKQPQELGLRLLVSVLSADR